MTSLVLCKENLQSACTAPCLSVKMTLPCPNNSLCRDIFKVSEGMAEARYVRSLLFHIACINNGLLLGNFESTSLKEIVCSPEGLVSKSI